MSETDKEEEKTEQLTMMHEGEEFSCKVTKKDDGNFVAECKVLKDKGEECPGCAEAIAVGWALNYIKPHDEEKADQLFRQVTNDKISPDEAMDECIVVAEQNEDKELVDTLQHLKEIMHKPLAELEKEGVEEQGTEK